MILYSLFRKFLPFHQRDVISYGKIPKRGKNRAYAGFPTASILFLR